MYCTYNILALGCLPLKSLITSTLGFLQECSWTQARPGARCSNARQCAACSRALRAIPPLCHALPVKPSSAQGAEGPGETATPVLSTSPWCHLCPLMKTGQSAAHRLPPQSLGCALILCWKQGQGLSSVCKETLVASNKLVAQSQLN